VLDGKALTRGARGPDDIIVQTRDTLMVDYNQTCSDSLTSSAVSGSVISAFG
jgi:hypothetical protein